MDSRAAQVPVRSGCAAKLTWQPTNAILENKKENHIVNISIIIMQIPKIIMNVS